MPDGEQTQLILDELANDPRQTRGPRVVKEALNLAGHKIGRNKISDVMHTFEEEGFEKRDPKAQKKTVKRTPLTAVGPHEEWSMDGHDKMNEAGFGIYGIRDKWGGKFLHYRTLPSNRFADVIGVVFLECAKKYGGIPIQGSSDHGSEVRDAHAAQKTLRQTSNWIWFPLVQRSLDTFCNQQNNHRVRRQDDKLLPSGGTPNQFCANPMKYNGVDCLIKVPAKNIDELLDEARETAREHMRYVDDDFDILACEAYEALNKPAITLQSAWVVFRAMVEQLNRM
ncbi:hypothetical protein R3P38DRAFT_2815563 [Favolaschia claudopus]|uniref:Integrase catalytic domain-containing protein n=1 Tax=Favolaschia claudopus TaxID=2862362 RepID=A0AAV9Z143_9AGAR